MLKNLRIYFEYFCFLTVFFILGRGLFLLANTNLTNSLSFFEILKTFWFGIRMDFSVSGYLLVMPALFLLLSAFIDGYKIWRLFSVYSFMVLFILSGIITIDAGLYKHWGFRLDNTPLLYLNNPKEIIGSATVSETATSAIIFIILMSVSYYLFQKIFKTKIQKLSKLSYKTIPLHILLIATLIVPIRGSFSVAPMNISFVYFHTTNLFANHAAINVVWNVISSIMKTKKTEKITFFQENEALKIFEELKPQNDSTIQVINNFRPNIILITVESFTAKLFETLGSETSYAPRTESLRHEGIWFTNFYASGDRTAKGLVALLSGFPSQPTTVALKDPKKNQKLPSITELLNKQGYTTAFVYGGDINFANMNSYLVKNQFNNIISDKDFPFSEVTSKWGVHDHFVLNKALQTCNNATAPFFVNILTSSIHEPFDVPFYSSKELITEEEKFLHAAKYADSAIFDFIEKAKNMQWWNNSLIIITADHGARHPLNSSNFEAKRFHIPMLWIGGALAVKDTIITTYADQTDLAATLLSQLKISTNSFLFSKNIFSNPVNSFAFYDYNNGFGYATDSGNYVIDLTSKEIILKAGNITSTDIEKGKAFLQILLQNFEEL